MASDQPVTPRDAATVLLLRDAPSGDRFEVFLLKRTASSKFSPGSYVFPGGAREDSDLDPAYAQVITGLDDDQASRMLGVGCGGLAFWVSVVRECFEEAGVLLAVDASGDFISLNTPEKKEKFTEYRESLNSDRVTLLEICRREELQLPLSELHYFRRWITPEALPKRYDTRFFLTRVPQGQTARHDGVETVEHRWISPQQALDAHRRNELSLMHPTVKELEFLAGFRGISGVIEEVVKQPNPQTILPVVKLTEDGKMHRIEIRDEREADHENS